jgi:hypothetical protein
MTTRRDRRTFVLTASRVMYPQEINRSHQKPPLLLTARCSAPVEQQLSPLYEQDRRRPSLWSARQSPSRPQRRHFRTAYLLVSGMIAVERTAARVIHPPRHAHARPALRIRPPSLRSARQSPWHHLGKHFDTTYPLVIPEGAGPCQPQARGACDRFLLIPGSVRAYAGEGSGSRLDRRSTRVSGLGLDADPERAQNRRAGNEVGEVVGVGRVLSNVRSGRCGEPGVRLPVIPSPPTIGWHGVVRPQPGTGSIRDVDHATGGGQTSNDRASWLRRNHAHAGRARQRMCPSRSP